MARVVAAGEDHVVARAAEHHVGTVADVDQVVAAELGRGGLDLGEHVGGEERPAAVAEHHVARRRRPRR